MNFASDNWSGASPKVLAAVAAANDGAMPAYGDDALTARVRDRLCDLFEREVHVFLTATGTGANALALASLAPSWGGAVVCHENAHVHSDEGGAAEFYAGVKCIPIAGADGKITDEGLHAALARYPRRHPNVHNVAATVLSLTNLTECGTAYDRFELARLGLIAKENGLAVHLDGARFANAVASLETSPADLTWRAGVDIFTLGATKNGCLMAEAIIAFHSDFVEPIERMRMRAGHLVSKQRFIAAQFDAWLDDEHWLDLADHANAMATRLAEGLEARSQVRLAFPRQGNEVFAVLPGTVADALRAEGARFHDWGKVSVRPENAPREGEGVVRLVCSHATTEVEIDRFLALIR